MKFGFFSMPEIPLGENWTLSYDREIDRMVYAEKMGFDEYWIGEHHSDGYENVPVPEYMLAKASALTHRIRLATGCVAAPVHDPFQVAERLAFLDHLTHGRLIAGFGQINLPSDQVLFDIPREELKPRMHEAIGAIQKYLTSDEPVTHEGKYWNYKNPRSIQVKPYQKSIPIAVPGVTSTSSFEYAAENGFGSLSIYLNPVRTQGETVFPGLYDQGVALDSVAKRKGLDPHEFRKEWRVSREVYVAESREQAIEEIRKGVEDSYGYLKKNNYLTLMKTHDNVRDEDMTIDWMIEEMPWIIGSPEDCIQQIKKLQNEIGEFGYLLINVRHWTSNDLWKRSIEMFARRVMPAFK